MTPPAGWSTAAAISSACRAGTVAAFGDVVTALAVPSATPNDRRSHVVYDNDGQARFSLKATGAAGWVVSENRYDANGNVIEVRAYDRFLPDARVAASIPPVRPASRWRKSSNELTTLGYRDDDPATLAGVQRTFFAYDANNRRRFTVDPSGSVIENVYDAAGNVTATVRFAARPTLTEHTEAAIDAAVDRDDRDNRVTRYAYDAANRLRYTVDALGSVSENEYDARGNVVTTVRWATRPVLTQYTESAIAAALAAMPAGRDDEVTRLVYDAANRLRFTIDATGSVSENGLRRGGQCRRSRRASRGVQRRRPRSRRRGRCGGRSAAQRCRKPGHPLRLRCGQAAALCGRRTRLGHRKRLRRQGQSSGHDPLCRAADARAVRRKRDRCGGGAAAGPILAIAPPASPTTRSIACASPSMRSARSANASTTRWAT